MNAIQKQYANSFLIITTCLMVIGLIFVFSSSSVFALETYGSSFYFLKKQIIGLILGIIALVFIQTIPSHYIKYYSPYTFWGSVALTALTLVPQFTSRIHGSSRWLKIAGFTFQPSELLKIALILYLAYCIANRNKKYSFIYGYLPVITLLIIPSIILLLQPDFGLTVTLFLTTLIMLFIGNYELRHVLYTVFSLIPFGIILIIMRPYRMKRILTFLNPWQDPKGAGFQIIQSLIAIGSGGLWGLGIGHSRQKFFYLPMQHTDFIFSIIAEETGFIGCLFIIILYVLMLYFMTKLALSISDVFTRSVIFGFAILTNLQAIINMGVASGLLPTKGIGLPFISYGNTALVCNILMIGIILNLLRTSK